MRPRWIRAGLVALLVALSLPAVATAAPTFSDPNFSYQPLVTGLPRPTAAAWTPDGRMLIVTKDGKLYAAAPNGSGPPTLKTSRSSTSLRA
jgi:glucose/arabinose dehydrogenase